MTLFKYIKRPHMYNNGALRLHQIDHTWMTLALKELTQSDIDSQNGARPHYCDDDVRWIESILSFSHFLRRSYSLEESPSSVELAEEADTTDFPTILDTSKTNFPVLSYFVQNKKLYASILNWCNTHCWIGIGLPIATGYLSGLVVRHCSGIA